MSGQTNLNTCCYMLFIIIFIFFGLVALILGQDYYGDYEDEISFFELEGQFMIMAIAIQALTSACQKISLITKGCFWLRSVTNFS